MIKGMIRQMSKSVLAVSSEQLSVHRVPSVERFVYPLIFAVFVFVIWQSATALFHIPEYLLPAPLQIVRAMVSERGYFFHHGLTTLFEAALGFGLASVVGFGLGTVFAVCTPL